tara:strand:- start:88 stop:360 length:273 start_codon:yes stop_codon:yes gene_type:complete
MSYLVTNNNMPAKVKVSVKGSARKGAAPGARLAYDATRHSIARIAAPAHATTKKGEVRKGAKGVAGSRLAFDATKKKVKAGVKKATKSRK